MPTFPSISPLPFFQLPVVVLYLPAPPGHSHPSPSEFEEGAGQGLHRSGSQSHHELLLPLLVPPPIEPPPEAQALRAGRGMRLSIIPGSGPSECGLDHCLQEDHISRMCSPELGALPICSPQTLGWMGAVLKDRRLGMPGLKLQEKVGWAVPPRAGVTISSDWTVKSPVSGCLLICSFTDTPMGGRTREDIPGGRY